MRLEHRLIQGSELVELFNGTYVANGLIVS